MPTRCAYLALYRHLGASPTVAALTLGCTPTDLLVSPAAVAAAAAEAAAAAPKRSSEGSGEASAADTAAAGTPEKAAPPPRAPSSQQMHFRGVVAALRHGSARGAMTVLPCPAPTSDGSLVAAAPPAAGTSTVCVATVNNREPDAARREWEALFRAALDEDWGADTASPPPAPPTAAADHPGADAASAKRAHAHDATASEGPAGAGADASVATASTVKRRIGSAAATAGTLRTAPPAFAVAGVAETLLRTAANGPRDDSTGRSAFDGADKVAVPVPSSAATARLRAGRVSAALAAWRRATGQPLLGVSTAAADGSTSSSDAATTTVGAASGRADEQQARPREAAPEVTGEVDTTPPPPAALRRTARVGQPAIPAAATAAGGVKTSTQVGHAGMRQLEWLLGQLGVIENGSGGDADRSHEKPPPQQSRKR